METFQKVSAYLERYRWIIVTCLFALCISQQCTISSLRSQLEFLKDKYENPVQQSAPTTTEEQTYSEPETIGYTENTDNNTGTIIGCLFIIVGTMITFAWYKSRWPFTVWLKGKIWQDLNGRIVYTLTANNKGREAVTISDATIEFLNFKEQRKFKMPIADLPLTLTKGTKHTINISLQKLIGQHQELTSYKMIRVSMNCNGTIRHTIPLGVKWQQR